MQKSLKDKKRKLLFISMSHKAGIRTLENFI